MLAPAAIRAWPTPAFPGGASLGVLTGLAALTTGTLMLVRRRQSRS